MKILLFFGSGISLDSGYPCVEKINQSLRNDDWWHHSDQNFYSGINPSLELEKLSPVPYIKAFIKEIESYLNNYYAKRYDRQSLRASYEDIYYFIDSIEKDLYGVIESPTFLEYEPRLREFIATLQQNYPDLPDWLGIDSLEETCYATKQFIQSVVWENLRKPADVNIKGLDLIGELNQYKNTNKLDIVTLNHDLLIEQYLKNNKIEYFDWFSLPDENQNRFFIENFNELETNLKNTKVTLTKPHGSINWFPIRTTKENIPRLMLLKGTYELKDYTHITPGIMLPNFMCGSYNKIFSYGIGYYRFIQNLFIKRLWSHNTVIMSGYGWNDRGMNNHLFDWLKDTTQQNKLILLHNEPIIELKKKSKSLLYVKADPLIEQNKLIHIQKWLSETSLKDLQDYLN